MNSSQNASPKIWFNTFSSLAVVIGIVVGIGIFRLPPIVASNSPSELYFILFWVAGGFISLMGALCYAELASSMPDAGGEYVFLRKSFGAGTGFLLSWGRMTVIQTGSLALIAFILGDFASVLYNLGPFSSSIYASLTIILLTTLNILGTSLSGKTQNILTSTIIITIIPLAIIGLMYNSNISLTDTLLNNNISGQGNIGLAMIFVLLTYGGWSEAAYLSGELYNARKNIVKTLIIGILIITLIYILINLAYINVLGFENLKNSVAAGYDLTEKLFGQGTSIIVVFIIIASAISTANATIITGARTNYAIGRDFKSFNLLGAWNKKNNSPVNALIFQGSIALILIGIGTWSKETINTMVDYTAPVFWFFLIMTTLSIFIFRFKKQTITNAYKLPLYPLPPIIFLIACCYMFYSSVTYTGLGALIGLLILLSGIPIYLYIKNNNGRQ